MSRNHVVPGLFALFITTAVGCSGGDDFNPSDDDATGGASASGGKSSGGGGSSASGGSGATSTGGSGGTGGASGTGGEAGASGGTGGNPSGEANGSPCVAASECASGICADGVCCGTSCDGECQSCNVTGKAGTCTPHAADTNPENGCLGSAKTSGACTGTCDGKGACALPGAEKTCGASSCSAGKQTGKSCDGNGGCAEQQAACAPYVCGATACKTTCSVDADCASGNFCKAGSCAPKQELGVACTASSQCKSGNCVDGACCAAASCGTGFSCSTGVCQCNGLVCAAGDSCIAWYEDADGDGFGDKTKSVKGCSSKAPVGKTYVKDATDCYDANKNAFPGQTAFFATPRGGDGSYDYDCSGGEEKKFQNVGTLQCVDCHAYSVDLCSSGINCGFPIIGGTGTLESMGFECNAAGNCGGPKTTEGFVTDGRCGGAAYLKRCLACAAATPQSQGATQQQCR